MRSVLLEILREHTEEPISGEELAKKLGISRTAIWKNIQVLKKEGYAIEALPKKGYVLTKSTEKLLPRELERVLTTKWLGREFCYKDTTTSTNDICKQMAAGGSKEGLVCLAEEQSGGKGRLSRGWFSPKGEGLWFSLLLTPKFMPQEASKCTLLAAVAVVKAVNSYAGVEASIKWPNDILLQGKKLVGILTEMNAEFGHINYIVVGIGINVSVPEKTLPTEFRSSAISLQQVAQEKILRTELLAKVLVNFEELYEVVEEKGFRPILDQWRQYASTLGQLVKVVAPEETYQGKAVDIDDDGLLIVAREDGRQTKVLAGDVSIRGLSGKASRYD